MEGNYRRALAGSTDDPWLHGFGEGVVALAERAERDGARRTRLRGLRAVLAVQRLVAPPSSP